jgi:hypothetical protein
MNDIIYTIFSFDANGYRYHGACDDLDRAQDRGQKCLYGRTARSEVRQIIVDDSDFIDLPPGPALRRPRPTEGRLISEFSNETRLDRLRRLGRVALEA